MQFKDYLKPVFLKNYFFKLQVQPISFCLIGLITGILSHIYIKINLYLLPIFVIFIILILLYFKKLNFKNIILSLITSASFIVGFARAYLINKNYTNTIEEISNKVINIYGLIYLKQENNDTRYFKNTIFIKADKILIKNNDNSNKNLIKINYMIKLSYPNLDSSYSNISKIASGNYIKIKNVKINNKNKNSNFQISQNCLANLFLSKINFKMINKDFNIIEHNWIKIITIRQNLLNKLGKKLTRTTKAMFNYIFLGRQENNSAINKIKQYMTYWGINHYLARSGLHLVLIIYIWSFILKIMPIGYIFKKIVLIFLSILYTLLTIKSISFNRALLTVIVHNLCDLCKIPINYIHVINLICIISLLLNPYRLILLDFQLSFILTFVIYHIQELKIYNSKINPQI